jgi:hypothetical protein
LSKTTGISSKQEKTTPTGCTNDFGLNIMNTGPVFGKELIQNILTHNLYPLLTHTPLRKLLLSSSNQKKENP